MDLSPAAQTTAFQQAEVERPAAILVMSLLELVLGDLTDVLFQVASHRINPDRPNQLPARLVDQSVNQHQHQVHVKVQAHSSSSKQDPALT